MEFQDDRFSEGPVSQSLEIDEIGALRHRHRQAIPFAPENELIAREEIGPCRRLEVEQVKAQIGRQVGRERYGQNERPVLDCFDDAVIEYGLLRRARAGKPPAFELEEDHVSISAASVVASQSGIAKSSRAGTARTELRKIERLRDRGRLLRAASCHFLRETRPPSSPPRSGEGYSFLAAAMPDYSSCHER